MFDWFDDFSAVVGEVDLVADRVDGFVDYGYLAIQHFQLLFYALVILLFLVFIFLLMVRSRCKRIETKLNYLIGDDYDDYEQRKKVYRLFK